MAQVPPEIGTLANPVDVESFDQREGLVDNRVFEDIQNDPTWAFFDFPDPGLEAPSPPFPGLPREQQPRESNGTIDAPNSPTHDCHQAPQAQSPAVPHPVRASPLSGSNSTEVCLNKALELFPDVSHAYVKELCDTHHAAELHSQGDSSYVERVIESILADSSYPKRQKLKRKRTEEDPNSEWEKDEGDSQNQLYVALGIKFLGEDFPYVPATAIRQILLEKKRLFSAYLALSSLERTVPGHIPELPYVRLKHPRKHSLYDPLKGYRQSWWSHERPILRELAAANKKSGEIYQIALNKWTRAESEKRNEAEHTRAGTMVECQCCYVDVPPNRVVPCKGREQHPFCFQCVRKAAETQIGLMKYQLECFDTSGCQSEFRQPQLKQALGDALMKKLADLQQQDEVGRAGLEGLEDCPFCEFKAICAPVEEDKEFRCCNPDCEVVSCRICKLETHIPMSCDEAKRERGISNRHLVEEAMTEAFVRPCPKCKVPIVKELGCNKMVCSKCRTAMCYVCRKDITAQGYDHFSHRGGACSPNDDFNNQAQRDVDQAAKTAIEKLQAENPELTKEDLTVHLPEPESVQRARRRQDAVRRARMGAYRPPIAAMHPDRLAALHPEAFQDYQQAMPNQRLGFPQMPIPPVLGAPALNFGNNQPWGENGHGLFDGFGFRFMNNVQFQPHHQANRYMAPPNHTVAQDPLRNPVYGTNAQQRDPHGQQNVTGDPRRYDGMTRIPRTYTQHAPSPGQNAYTTPYREPHEHPPLPSIHGHGKVHRNMMEGRR